MSEGSVDRYGSGGTPIAPYCGECSEKCGPSGCKWVPLPAEPALNPVDVAHPVPLAVTVDTVLSSDRLPGFLADVTRLRSRTRTPRCSWRPP